jgi:malonyl-CoA decarboxylase
MRLRRLRILTQFNAIPQGSSSRICAPICCATCPTSPAQTPRPGVENRLTAWFDVGFLELQRITWQSPAALLEKLVQYEAVHEIRSWDDLKNRLDSDRRCYAFFHPRMPLSL